MLKGTIVVMKWKTIEKALVMGFVLMVAVTFSGFAGACEALPGEVLRLHVLANSDSEEDQALKLQVRDRILEESSSLMDGVSNKEEALRAAEEAIPALEKAAEDEVRRQGYSTLFPLQWKMYISLQGNMEIRPSPPENTTPCGW